MKNTISSRTKSLVATIRYLMNLIIFDVFSISLPWEYHMLSDQECGPETIRVEIAGSVTNGMNIFELPQWTGYLLWRQYINDLGGICVGGDMNMKNQCSGKLMKVCMVVKIIDDTTASDAQYTQALFEWIDELAQMPVNSRPHFIITPMGDNYVVSINEYVYKRYGSYGFNSLIVGSCAPDNGFSVDYKFAVTPIMRSEETSLPAIDIFHKRMGFRKWAILTDTGTIDYSINVIAAIEKNYKVMTNEIMEVVVKRCESQKFNLSAPNCKHVSDCGSEEDCVYPMINLSQYNTYQLAEIMKGWLKLIQQHDPDVLILNVDDRFSTYLTLLKEIKFAPRAIMGLARSTTVITPRERNTDNTYVYYASAFSEKVGYGYEGENKAYMGKTEDYIKYVDDHYIMYLNETIYPKSPVVFSGDYEYIGRGSLIGITIQRIAELASTIRNVNFEDDASFFTSYTFSNIISTFESSSSFSVCVSEDEETVTQNCKSISCKGGCQDWETFFGPVAFDNTHMNRELKSTLHQIQSYEDYTIPHIVAPSTSPICNQDDHVCTEGNGYSDCTCHIIYPCPYNWLPKEMDDYYFIDTASIALFITFSVILMLLDAFVFVFFSQNQRKFKIYKMPLSFSFWLFIPILLSIYQILIVVRKNNASCIFEQFVDNFYIFLFSFVPYFVNKEIEQENFKDNKLEINILSLFYVILLIRLTSVSKQGVTVENESFFGIEYYNICSNYHMQELVAYFIWLLLAVQLSYVLRRNPKRSKPVFELQIWYFIYGVLFGILQLIISTNEPINRNFIIVIYICYYILSLLYMLPIVIFILKKHSTVSYKDFTLKSLQRKNLRHFLRNKLLRQHLICFCDEKLSKAVEFFADVKEFEKIKDKSILQQKAEEILRKYIEEDYEFLNSEIRDNISAHYAVISNGLYREARDSAFEYILKNIWPSFYRSSEYEHALSDVDNLRYMLSRSNKIRTAIEISLQVSILNESLSSNEKDEIVCKYRIRDSSISMSRAHRSTTKSLSRGSTSQHSRTSVASKNERNRISSKPA